jgi:hypothetical protein
MMAAKMDTLQQTPSDKPLVHLADLQHPAHTLCGVPLAGAEIGAYVEELDSITTAGEAACFRNIYPLCGREAEPWSNCLARQQPVLKEVSVGDTESLSAVA